MCGMQDGTWMSINAYCNKKLSEDVRKKLKTVAQKRKYLTKDLGLEIQQARKVVRTHTEQDT